VPSARGRGGGGGGGGEWSETRLGSGLQKARKTQVILKILLRAVPQFLNRSLGNLAVCS